jgi:dynein heavy chain
MGLCKWVRAMFNFYHVNKGIKPKKDALAQANADLKESMDTLAEKQAELDVAE